MRSANTYTRRQWLTTVGGAAGAAALMPSLSLRAAEAKPMRGAFMILSTPYTDADEVDYEDLAGQVDFCERCGIHGLVWPQNSSEQRYLSKQERLRGFDVLAEAAKGRQPALVFGVQGDDTKGMLDYARHAEALAPDGMIAIPPTEAATLQEFRDYYAALCSVTGRPIFFQTSGGAPDVVPTVEFMVDMAREFPNLAYVKEEREPVHERMLALKPHRPDTIKSIFGAAFGRQWLYEMRLGMDGVMTGGVMYADIYARLWELHEAGKQGRTAGSVQQAAADAEPRSFHPRHPPLRPAETRHLQDDEVTARRLQLHAGSDGGDRLPPGGAQTLLPRVGANGRRRALRLLRQHRRQPCSDIPHFVRTDGVRHGIFVILHRVARGRQEVPRPVRQPD